MGGIEQRGRRFVGRYQVWLERRLGAVCVSDAWPGITTVLKQFTLLCSELVEFSSFLFCILNAVLNSTVSSFV